MSGVRQSTSSSAAIHSVDVSEIIHLIPNDIARPGSKTAIHKSSEAF